MRTSGSIGDPLALGTIKESFRTSSKGIFDLGLNIAFSMLYLFSVFVYILFFCTVCGC